MYGYVHTTLTPPTPPIPLDSVTKLNLKAKQQHQIPRVLLHCCGQSRHYNDYFGALAHALCQASLKTPRGGGKRSGQHWKWNAKTNAMEDGDIEGLRDRKEKKMIAKEGEWVRGGARVYVCVCARVCARVCVRACVCFSGLAWESGSG